MPSFLHQPGYEDFPVRLQQGLWQHSSRWLPTDFDFFTSDRQFASQQILGPPKIYRHKRKTSPSLDAYWIYKSEESAAPIGWAELQSFPGKRFLKGFLFFSLDQLPPEAAKEALVALTSLIFTVGRHDYLQLVPSMPSPTLVETLASFTGTVTSLLSLPASAWHPESGTPAVYPSLAVDRSSWRNCTALQDAQRSMKHIEMRLERLDRAGASGPSKKKRKRPFLVRLFKPRVDDSLF